MRHRGFRGTLLAAAAVGIGLAAEAGAAGFALIEQNGSGVGNAFAGAGGVAKDASTIFFNPADLTRLAGRQIAARSTHQVQTKFTNDGSTPPSLTGLPPSGSHSTGPAAMRATGPSCPPPTCPGR